MKFAFIDAEKATWSVSAMCRVLGVSRSGYHAWATRAPSERSKEDEVISAEIAAAYAKSERRYGSPRVHRDLRAKGRRIGRKRVERLMRRDGLVARRKRRFRRTTDSKHSLPIAPNLLERDFAATAPNRVWVTDVTYIATDQGWAYLAAILDLFSRRVVGWALSATNDTELALRALENACRGRRTLEGLIHHSDRGAPYASETYRAALATQGMVASMSRKGDCWDNAVAESFFATLRSELVDDAWYPTRAAAAASIGDYVARFYNLVRRHSYIDYTSPIEFELRHESLRLAA